MPKRSEGGLVAFIAAATVQVLPGAQPPAPQVPDYNAYYQIGPDSLPHDGVPKGEVRGPFVLPSQAYPGTGGSTPTASEWADRFCRR